MSKEDDIVLRIAKKPIDVKDIILNTGISGFLGLSLSKALAQDYCIAGLDWDCAADLDSESESFKRMPCIPCNLTSDKSVKEAMDELQRRFDKRIVSVIHLSGCYRPYKTSMSNSSFMPARCWFMPPPSPAYRSTTKIGRYSPSGPILSQSLR